MKEPLFGKGKFNEAYAQYFVGNSYLNPLIAYPNSDDLVVTNVTFEPGCRNAWHIHSNHQILLCTDGEGWYQEWGQPALKLHPGSVIDIKPGVKHWHGAALYSSFAHVSIAAKVKDSTTTWLEKVDEKAYLALGK
jgi:4-carboxymuconolactone decarboxylase